MNPDDRLTNNEKILSLEQARYSIETVVRGDSLDPIRLEEFPEKLREPGVTFVTLTIQKQLRGCVGALEAYQPLIEDVQEHAIAAAMKDFRFPPVSIDELNTISIEISRLTPTRRLSYDNPDELPNILRPGIDGVIIKDGIHRATFLPQVWKKLPSPVTFLGHLCQKMGSPADLWRHKKLEILVYEVEEFQE